MPTATKATPKKEVKETPKTEVEEQIEILEPIAKAVDRELVHPETGEKRVYVQHELSFLPKLKFIRLLSGTLRLSATDDQGGVGHFLTQTLSGLQGGDNEQFTSEFLSTILAFAEMAPDFMEEAILLALSVKPADHQWALESLENLSDEDGLDIIEVFVAQNGVSLRDFFTRRLPKIGKRLNKELQLDQPQESETTA